MYVFISSFRRSIESAPALALVCAVDAVVAVVAGPRRRDAVVDVAPEEAVAASVSLRRG
jgi:hypothetical protein